MIHDRNHELIFLVFLLFELKYSEIFPYADLGEPSIGDFGNNFYDLTLHN